jgi:hypothetical protein
MMAIEGTELYDKETMIGDLSVGDLFVVGESTYIITSLCVEFSKSCVCLYRGGMGADCSGAVVSMNNNRIVDRVLGPCRLVEERE